MDVNIKDYGIDKMREHASNVGIVDLTVAIISAIMIL